MPRAKPDHTDVIVGPNIRALRLAHGLTQRVLAAKVGVTYQQLQKNSRRSLSPTSGKIATESESLYATCSDEPTGLHAMLQQSPSAFVRASEGPRHHYIPVFYLKNWVGLDGRLCQYSRPYNETKALRKYPKATGYVRGLYNIPGLPAKSADVVEKHFMALADDWAARALRVLLSSSQTIDFPDLRVKAGWARFIYSLVLRNPEYLENSKQRFLNQATETVDSIKDKYIELRQPNDPPTFEEFRERFLSNPTNTSIQRFLHRLIDSQRVIPRICLMQWFTLTIDNSHFSFLTSDRPVIMSNGLVHDRSHIVMPISPRRLFIAANSDAMAQQLRYMPSKKMVQRSNDRVCAQARRFVYGVDDSQIRFVARRLGRMERSTPLE
jgi:transcriptional regulator with XRE-family HTH domain